MGRNNSRLWSFKVTDFGFRTDYILCFLSFVENIKPARANAFWKNGFV